MIVGVLKVTRNIGTCPALSNNQNIQTFSALTKNQKEAVGLLSIGTFLEYFDLMSATRGC